MKLTKTTITWLTRLYKVAGASFRYVPLNQDIPNSLLEKGQPYINAFWHDEIISIPPSARCYSVPFKAVALTSPSKDGDLVEAMCNAYGIDTIRGSSSKGGFSAIRELKKRIENHANNIISIAVDGPRGPAKIVKPGIIYLANVLKIPIVTMRFLASPVAITHKSWDSQKIPLPFAKTYIIYGEPYYVEGKLTEERLAQESSTLQEKLNDISLLRKKKR